jgi:hypothetical protein
VELVAHVEEMDGVVNVKMSATIIGICVLLWLAVFVPHFSQQPMPAEVAMGVSEPRSPEWPKVRAEHLRTHLACESCGQKDHLQVHHVLPFHVEPKMELDPSNLITLCTDGPCNLNCHFVWGHLGNTKCNNPNVREDAAFFRKRLENRPCE